MRERGRKRDVLEAPLFAGMGLETLGKEDVPKNEQEEKRCWGVRGKKKRKVEEYSVMVAVVVVVVMVGYSPTYGNVGKVGHSGGFPRAQA